MPVPVIDPIPRAGWEPDPPGGDSLLRWFVVNWTENRPGAAARHGP